MKRVACLLLFAVIVSTAFFGCSKKSDSTSPDTTTPASPLTAAEQAAIRTAHAAISASADSILLTSNPVAGFSTRLAVYKANVNVDTAWIKDQTLFVRYKKGGIVFWNVPTSVVVPPYDGGSAVPDVSPLPRLARTGELVGNKKALLINQQYNDDSRQYCKDLITHLSTGFVADTFTVTVKNGAAADVAFFKTGLKGYGAIFYIAHGMYDGTRTWQCTAEPGSMDGLFTTYSDDWVHDRISLGGVTEKHGATNVVANYYTFSDLLISSNYAAGDFPHSLIYLVACQAFKGTNQIGQVFNAAGAAATVGWTETNCLGQSTGKLLFDAMLGGATLAEAFGALPAESKLDKCEVPAGAALTYYPNAGGTVQLIQAPAATFQITSPTPGQTYTDRTLTLSGQLLNVSSISSGTVEVSGVTTTLTYSGTTFSQPIVIKQGSNTIRLRANGTNSSGKILYGDTSFTVTGNFAALGLWTELRWNTNASDVDFHLLPPGSSVSALWTSSDCYYSNKLPSWGGSLDVDDVDGYGPEHITIPTVSVTGTYRLFIHYYATHGASGTAASVTVSSNGGADVSFGPYALNSAGTDGHGDVWEVCTITYPGGAITPVNQLTTLATLGKVFVTPPKH